MRRRAQRSYLRGCVLFWVAATTGWSAAADAAPRPAEVPLKFERIDLSDGRVLKNVVVKSYDAKTEKLLLIADGKAMMIPIALVPPPFDRHLKRAPASGVWVSTSSSPRPMATAADQYDVAVPVVVPGLPKAAPAKEPKAPGQAAPSRPPLVLHVPAGPAPSPEPAAVAVVARHAAAAQQRAQNYFRYEFPIGSSSIKVTVLDFEWGTPKAVPGWDGRYETQGKAYLEFFDSKGFSFQRATRSFEIVTEQKTGEDMTVVDLRLKN